MSNRVERFEDLRIWQSAFALSKEIYRITSDGLFSRDFGLRDQMRRAAVSVMSNIAEGFERHSNQDFSRFLAIARGSCAEVRSQLYLAHFLGYITPEQFEKLCANAESLSKSIGALRNAAGGRKGNEE
jgi:four helix bundle protein